MFLRPERSALNQLSYIPKILMKLAGLEPALASLEDSCSHPSELQFQTGHMGFEPMIFTLRV